MGNPRPSTTREEDHGLKIGNRLIMLTIGFEKEMVISTLFTRSPAISSIMLSVFAMKKNKVGAPIHPIGFRIIKKGNFNSVLP